MESRNIEFYPPALIEAQFSTFISYFFMAVGVIDQH